MAQFEAEVRNSIGQLQATVAKLAAETERANTSMRGLAASTRQTATEVDRVGVSGDRSMRAVARGATAAGAGFGGITSALAGLNPMFVATGLAVGGIVTGVTSLVTELVNASAKAEQLAAGIAKAKQAAAGVELKAALDVDAPKERAAAFAGAAPALDPEIEAAVARATGIGVSREDAIRRATEARARRGGGLFGTVPLSGDQLAGAAAGFEGDAEDFLRRERSVARSPREQVRREAERLQRIDAEIAAERAANLSAGGAGFTAPRLSADAIAALNPDTAKKLAELIDILHAAQKSAAEPGMRFRFTQEARLESVRQAEANLESYRANLVSDYR